METRWKNIYQNWRSSLFPRSICNILSIVKRAAIKLCEPQNTTHACLTCARIRTEHFTIFIVIYVVLLLSNSKLPSAEVVIAGYFLCHGKFVVKWCLRVAWLWWACFWIAANNATVTSTNILEKTFLFEPRWLIPVPFITLSVRLSNKTTYKVFMH